LSDYILNPASYTDGCWIIDDTVSPDDPGAGWCYWSQPLEKGQATNLLLDNVLKKEGMLPDDNFAYFIDVQLQASNKTELGKFLDSEDISDDAMTIWDVPAVVDVELSDTNEDPFDAKTTVTLLPGDEDDTLRLFAKVNGNTALGNNVLQKVYWSIIGPSTDVEIDQNGVFKVTGTVAGGASFTVRAISYADTSVSQDIVVVVGTP